MIELTSPKGGWLRLLLVGLALALFMSVWLQTPWTELFTILRAISILKLVALLLLDGVIVYAMSGRWWFILRGMGHTLPNFTLSQYRLAAFGISYFTPGPQFGGEPLQVWVLTRYHGIKTSTALASVTVDKLLELLVNFMVLGWGLGVVLQTAVFPSLSSEWGATIGLLLWIIPLLLLILLIQNRAPFSTAVHWLSHRLSRKQTSLQSIAITLRESEQKVAELYQQAPRQIWLALLATGVTWVLWFYEFWFMYALLGLRVEFVELLVLLTAVRIAFLLPSPGGLGTLEASQFLAITAIGQPAAIGLSMTLLIRLRDVAIASFGMWLAMRKYQKK